MNQLNQWREYLVCIYKRYESVILFVYKLFIGILIFSFINSIGHARPEFASLGNSAVSFIIVLLLGVFYAILPINAVYTLIILAIGIQYSVFLELTVLILIFLFLILLFYARLAPKESLLIVGILFAYYFNMPYIVPIYAGLYCGLTSIIPITIGVFIWNAIPVINNSLLSLNTASLDIMEMPNTFAQLYARVMEFLTKDIGWISTSFVFAMVVIIVFIVVRLSFNYSKEIAIGLGAVLNIVGFIIVALVSHINNDILAMLVSTIFSWAFVMLISFFDLALDYQRASNLRFEDDENYYYVKVIPKVIMNRSSRAKTPIQKTDATYDHEGYDDYQPY